MKSQYIDLNYIFNMYKDERNYDDAIFGYNQLLQEIADKDDIYAILEWQIYCQDIFEIGIMVIGSGIIVKIMLVRLLEGLNPI
ncbi:MAG: hypothetical protein ABF579_00455 [Liquorilactobacillus hordei]